MSDAALRDLAAIVAEQIFGDGTAASQQRVIDLCNAAKARHGITRENAEHMGAEPTPLTSDIGIFIRDMIEGKPFKLLKLDGDAYDEVGDDEVTFVDVSDAHNPRIHTESGAIFVAHIVKEV